MMAMVRVLPRSVHLARFVAAGLLAAGAIALGVAWSLAGAHNPIGPWLGGLAMGFAASAVLSFFVVDAIVGRPLRKLAVGALTASRADEAAPVWGRERGDEIGLIARAVEFAQADRIARKADAAAHAAAVAKINAANDAHADSVAQAAETVSHDAQMLVTTLKKLMADAEQRAGAERKIHQTLVDTNLERMAETADRLDAVHASFAATLADVTEQSPVTAERDTADAVNDRTLGRDALPAALLTGLVERFDAWPALVRSALGEALDDHDRLTVDRSDGPDNGVVGALGDAEQRLTAAIQSLGDQMERFDARNETAALTNHINAIETLLRERPNLASLGVQITDVRTAVDRLSDRLASDDQSLDQAPTLSRFTEMMTQLEALVRDGGHGGVDGARAVTMGPDPHAQTSSSSPMGDDQQPTG